MDTDSSAQKLNVLLIGSGVIGSIYGGQFSLAGHNLWVLAFGKNGERLQKTGIRLNDIASGATKTAKVTMVRAADERVYDLVIVAVRADQLGSTFPTLHKLKGRPHILFFGNNPDGHKAIPKDLPGTVQLGFPGIAGRFDDGIVKYAHIAQQKTMLETADSKIGSRIDTILHDQGFPLDHTANMDGWLAYHSVLIASVSMALLRANGKAAMLGNDRQALKLMCRSIEEGFGMLRAQGMKGLPRNLAILHWAPLRLLAVHYWGSVMRSKRGEMYFAAHVRSAPDEVSVLSKWVLVRTKTNQPETEHLRRLLDQSEKLM